MEMPDRYCQGTSVDVSIVSTSMATDPMAEEILRDDLRFYFMSPCEKYRTRRQLPWKLAVQILKIFMITLQLILFGLNNQLVVSYKEENLMAFKSLFLKGYSGVDEDDYSIAVYTKQSVYDSLHYVIDQYSQLGNLSVGPVSYAEENEKFLPLSICKKSYKKGSIEPSEEAYDIDAELETVCLTLDPESTKTWRMDNASFFELDFYSTGLSILRSLLRSKESICKLFVLILFDNSCHSGKVKSTLDFDTVCSVCKNWKISGTAQKSTHYLLIFDGFVIVVCLISAVLCTRSIILAVRLLQRFSSFCLENYNQKVCEDEQREFLNGWYILVIISDVLAIIGSILKMEIQAKSMTNYDVCSIFLGTSTLMVWVGVIRYLGYFEKYNVLILTMRAALPKVLRFCCCAGMIYLGYTFCGWIVLGPYHEKFEGLSRVAECLFSLVNGDDMFPTFAQFEQKNTMVWLFSRAYLYSFISLFIYMVLSLFIALITDAYETIKGYQTTGFPMTELQRFLMGQKEDFPLQGQEGVGTECGEAETVHPSVMLCCCKSVPKDDTIILIS
uniref:Mucolipin-2-like n=1 Tax=Sinocyclocheilus rhinocerous TaxID=307959 RepID=A0A673LGG5_9TELE